MNWKEFLRPSWGKMVWFFLILFLSGIVFAYAGGIPGREKGDPIYILFGFLFAPLHLLNLIIPGIVLGTPLLFTMVILFLYLYLWSCAIVWIFHIIPNNTIKMFLGVIAFLFVFYTLFAGIIYERKECMGTNKVQGFNIDEIYCSNHTAYIKLISCEDSDILSINVTQLNPENDTADPFIFEKIEPGKEAWYSDVCKEESCSYEFKMLIPTHLASRRIYVYCL